MKLVFVHRFRWSHDDKRREYRRKLKDGEVKLVARLRDGWLYGIPTKPSVVRRCKIDTTGFGPIKD